jgi:hypothetical protein
MKLCFTSLLTTFLIASLSLSSSAGVVYIGDNDGYGVGLSDNADHPFNGFTAGHDFRDALEKNATNGAQFTDTYSTTHPGFGPQAGTVATFTFAGLGSYDWSAGSMWFDMADFQASTFGAVEVTYNGYAQNWAFNDGYPETRIRNFDLSTDVLTSIETLGSLTVEVNRAASGDFYGFDFAMLSNNFVANTTLDDAPLSPIGGVMPSAVAVSEPSTILLLGLGLIGLGLARRKTK